MRQHIAITVLLGAALLCSCRNVKHRVWSGYGQPGSGKIVVFISGWVEHPGRYYLENDVTLEHALTLFGEFRGLGIDGKPSSKVTLRRLNGGDVERTVYKFREMTRSEREGVRLRDGDEMDFTVGVF
jgi:hypothetical protein